jgi:proteic killer suppression protein
MPGGYQLIGSFRHKGLEELFFEGHSSKVAPKLARRCLVRLDALNAATSLDDLKVPSFRCHPLKGFSPKRFAITVNGPWRITFSWTADGPAAVDLEQYH